MKPAKFDYHDPRTLDEALSLLEPVVCSAKAAGHHDILIGSLILVALAYQKKGARNTGPMLKVLEEVLNLAEPGGYMRAFLNEGQCMQTLLAQWLAHASAGPLRDYAARLLSQFEAEKRVVTAQEKASPAFDPSASSLRSGQALVEPLSPRELEVLHLIALGKTNEAIARQLIVSRGTVKAHTASIYRKLDVNSRTQAIARGRNLGLV